MGKMKRWQKVLSSVTALIIVAVFGFMGIQQFKPQERSLKIIDSDAVTTAAGAADDEITKNNDNEYLDIKAKAAVLIDGNSGEMLYGQNEKKHLPPASVTKVMTLLLILEGCESGQISFDDKVVISERAAGMGGSQMYMEMGETHTVEELLKGVIMVSANDACVALAEHLSGSVEGFVKNMNERAEEMGLKDSNFINTNGLPVAEHFSCAYDIGMISRELMEHEDTHQWFTAWQEDIKVGLPGKESKFTLTNTNKLIKNYSYAIGVKTGYTDDAGYCLSGAAENKGSRFIAVVLGCETSDIRFEETQRLLEHGFANFETKTIAEKGEKIKKITLEKGEPQKLYAVTREAIKLTVEREKVNDIEIKVRIYDDIKLPISKNDKIGTITVYIGDKEKYTFELVSDRSVEKIGAVNYYIRKIKKIL